MTGLWWVLLICAGVLGLAHATFIVRGRSSLIGVLAFVAMVSVAVLSAFQLGLMH